MPKKILVVDDSEIILKYIQNMFSNGEVDFLYADNGFKGLDKIKKNPDIDLLILDLNMPGKNGFQVIEELMTLSLPKQPKIMILSAEASQMTPENKKKYNVLAWIIKPFNTEALKKTIIRLLA